MKPKNDRVAVIVGSSSGMGRATAIAFARNGMQVVLAARSESKLKDVAVEIGNGAMVCPTDVTAPDSVERLLASTLEKLGRVDILVYATGTNIPDRSLEVLSVETWEMMMSTNLNGAFYCAKAVLPIMRKQKSGLIIYISTKAVLAPDASGVSYQASKSGLSGLAHGTFLEECENGIRTTVIFPGLCDTPLVLKRPTPTPPEVLAKALQPEDVAEACLFVANLHPRTRVPELSLVPAGL